MNTIRSPSQEKSAGTNPVKISLPPRPRETPIQKPIITIDTLAVAFQKTLLHPFVAWTLPIVVRAQGTRYSDTTFIVTAVYATIITLLHILAAINHRLAFGAARPIDWDDEVVLITGGGSGLGLLLAEIYALKGVPVAVVDIKSPEEVKGAVGTLLEHEDVRYYSVDVGDAKEVERLKDRVAEDLGPPTILINCAAVAPLEPLYTPSSPTPSKTTTTTYAANILSNHHTIRAFLPAMLAAPNGGTIVTVSSVLGTLGCAALPAYCATKAAQTALHHSLAAELHMLAAQDHSHPPQHPDPTASASPPRVSPARVKTVLVTLGQLDTPLFAHVRSPSWFWGPPVDASAAAAAICRVVDAGDGGEVALPLYAGFVGVLGVGVLPAAVRAWARGWSGLDAAGWGAWVASRGKGDGKGEGEGR